MKNTRSYLNSYHRVLALISVPMISILNLIDRPMRYFQKTFGQKRMPYFFLLPNLIFFGTFVIVPLIINFFYSVTGGVELFLANRPYVGSQHFRTLLDCKDYFNPGSCEEDLFWRAVYNTIWFVTVQVGLMVIFSLMTALVLNQKIIARGFFRAVFFFPVLLSPVVVALMWKWILQRQGVLNGLLAEFGIEKILFFVDAGWSMFWAIFVSIWAHMGFYTLIILAGLQAIPNNLYEAAEMDGTRRFRVFYAITLPLLWPNLLVVIILALIKSVQTFDEVFVLTGGGPGTATQFMVQYIYNKGFADPPQDFGMAASASYLLAIVLIIMTLAHAILTVKSPVRNT